MGIAQAGDDGLGFGVLFRIDVDGGETDGGPDVKLAVLGGGRHHGERAEVRLFGLETGSLTVVKPGEGIPDFGGTFGHREEGGFRLGELSCDNQGLGFVDLRVQECCGREQAQKTGNFVCPHARIVGRRRGSANGVWANRALRLANGFHGVFGGRERFAQCAKPLALGVLPRPAVKG